MLVTWSNWLFLSSKLVGLMANKPLLPNIMTGKDRPWLFAAVRNSFTINVAPKPNRPTKRRFSTLGAQNWTGLLANAIVSTNEESCHYCLSTLNLYRRTLKSPCTTPTHLIPRGILIPASRIHFSSSPLTMLWSHKVDLSIWESYYGD
jgi:hypothetical protein